MKTDKLLTPTTAATIQTKATTIINTLNSKRPTVIVYPTGKCHNNVCWRMNSIIFITFTLIASSRETKEPSMK